MTRRKQILVIGSDKDHCSETAYRTAYQVGAEVAKRGAVLLSGGLGGVMEAASRGAKEAGGFVIGIIPQDEKKAANAYCDVVIATGIGHARDFLTAYSADAIIVVEGGSGTMIEISAAYQKMIPIIGDYASQNGFVLVIDDAQIPVYYAAKEIDIQAEIVKRFDAANPLSDAGASPQPAAQHP